MKIVAHISDLHFGKDDPRIVAGLVEALHRAAADVLVVSGDLTQRAKKRQFRAAMAFLGELPPIPRIIVPGNHDVSTTNLFERVVQPLKRYNRIVTRDMTPFYSDDTVAIAGVNTVRLMSTKDGRLNRSQVERVCGQFGTVPAELIRIVVTHHPMDVPAGDLDHPTLTRAKMAMGHFARCGVDLFLSGHLHSGLTLASSARYPLPGYSAVVVHAGTAVSTRTRGEPNAWNLIRLEAGAISVQQMVWNTKKFAAGRIEQYSKGPDGWRLAVQDSGAG